MLWTTLSPNLIPAQSKSSGYMPSECRSDAYVNIPKKIEKVLTKVNSHGNAVNNALTMRMFYQTLGLVKSIL